MREGRCLARRVFEAAKDVVGVRRLKHDVLVSLQVGKAGHEEEWLLRLKAPGSVGSRKGPCRQMSGDVEQG